MIYIYTRIFQCIFLSHHFITSHHFVFLALIPRIPRCEEARRVVISDLWDLCAECWSHFAACWTWNFWICFGCQSLKVEASQDLEFQSPSTCSHLFPSVPICSLCCDVWDLVPGVCVRSSTVRICAFSSKLQGGGQRPQRDSSRLPRLPGFKFWLGLQTGGNRIVRQDMAGLLRYQWLSVQQYTPCWTGRLLTELSARPVLSATSAGVCAAVVTWKSWSYIDRTAELCHVWCEPWS